MGLVEAAIISNSIKHSINLYSSRLAEAVAPLIKKASSGVAGVEAFGGTKA